MKQPLRTAPSTATGLRVNPRDRRPREQRRAPAVPSAVPARAPPAPGAAPPPPRTPHQQARTAAEVAAGRFYDNPNLDLPTLGAPLVAQPQTAVRVACRQ